MTWKDINIQQYIDLYNLKSSDDTELFIKQIAIVKKLTIEQVENIPITDLNSLKTELQFLANEPEQTDVQQEVVINGEHYFLKKNFLDFTLGEWIDIEAFNKDFINNLHRILAVFYLKKEHKGYNPAECDAAAEAFLTGMDIQTALSALFFFYLFGLHFIPSDIKDYSTFQIAEMSIQQKLKEIRKETSTV